VSETDEFLSRYRVLVTEWLFLHFFQVSDRLLEKMRRLIGLSLLICGNAFVPYTLRHISKHTRSVMRMSSTTIEQEHSGLAVV